MLVASGESQALRTGRPLIIWSPRHALPWLCLAIGTQLRPATSSSVGV